MQFLVFELWLILYLAVLNSVELSENLVGFIAKYAVDASLFRIGVSILKHERSRGVAPVDI